MEIADGIFTYRGRRGDKIRPGAGSSSVTVVGKDALIMIDTGVVSGGAFDELVAAMKRDRLDVRVVRRVVFTHAHWDHLNAAGKVVSLSGADACAARAETPFVEDDKKNFGAFLSGFPEFIKEIFPFPLPVAKLLVRYAWGRQPALTVSKELDDGDPLGAGREIRAVAFPAIPTAIRAISSRTPGCWSPGTWSILRTPRGWTSTTPDRATNPRSAPSGAPLRWLPPSLSPATGSR